MTYEELCRQADWLLAEHAERKREQRRYEEGLPRNAVVTRNRHRPDLSDKPIRPKLSWLTARELLEMGYTRTGKRF